MANKAKVSLNGSVLGFGNVVHQPQYGNQAVFATDGTLLAFDGTSGVIGEKAQWFTWVPCTAGLRMTLVDVDMGETVSTVDLAGADLDALLGAE